MPHTGTLRTWYSLSTSNGKPGVQEDSLNALRNLAENMNASGRKLVCSLSLDEMAIRRHVQWSDIEKIFFGRISYGSRTEENSFEVANNAIVFMINGVNDNFNIPVAYHFIRELDGKERAVLLETVLTKVCELNIRVISVTFDGLPANIKMCERMGASFERKDLRPYFYFPSAADKTYIILDPSHMLKLARNAIGKQKILYDGNGGKIEWKYFQQLEIYRSEKGYVLAHKLTKKHIQWERAPMRVHLATETLSNSVANAMTFLNLKGKKEFANCLPTVRFIRYFNNVFDSLNSKGVTDSKFKTSITPDNHLRFLSYFQETIQYISSLKMGSGKSILFSKRKTAFRGLIIDMMNIESIYSELVDSKLIQNLNTFCFSQDPLESLFGRIRSLNGCNNNPNVQQFCAAFRKVTVNTEINCSSFSNCVDSLNILTISSQKSKISDTTKTGSVFGVQDYLKYIKGTEQFPQFHKCDASFDMLESCSIAHVAKTIEQRVMNCGPSGRFKCETCFYVFTRNDKVDVLGRKNGPCESSYQICSIANKHFKACMFELQFDYRDLLDKILRSINYKDLFSKTDFRDHEHHKFYIVLFIVEEYLRIQANYVAKQATLNEQAKMLRSKLTKIITFSGQ